MRISDWSSDVCSSDLRTLLALDWLEQPDLRRACQAGLNKGEARHTLAAAIYTNRQGRFTDRSIENQEYRASGLNLLIAAISYWNTVYMDRAVQHLQSSVGTFHDALLDHLSPMEIERAPVRTPVTNAHLV